MDNKEEVKKVYVVKNKYDEIQGIVDTESEANQFAAYLNSRFLRAQHDIKSGAHSMKYSVKGYPVKEFYRKKKLYWLITVYFDKFTSKTGCPFSICNVEKTMIIDYEVEDELNMRGVNTTHHIYFSAPYRSTKDELYKMAIDKLHKYWHEGKLIE